MTSQNLFESIAERKTEYKGTSAASSNNKAKVKSRLLADTRDQLSALGVESSIRSDVLYKTIIRDMRKFLSKDFNTKTMFIKRKRYKCDQYFFLCLREYLTQRFEDFGSSVFIE
jgi:hypothetical protein